MGKPVSEKIVGLMMLVHLWTHKFQQNVSAFLVSGIILMILSLELIKILYGTL
jgi:hypothetical protein